MTKFLRVLLFVCILSLNMAVYTAIVSAEPGTWGNNLKWNISNGTLTISGKGDMGPAPEDGNFPWNDEEICDQITKIIINEGVTSIAKNAFIDLYKLTDITIAETVVAIGEGTISDDVDDTVYIHVYKDSFAQKFEGFKTNQYFTISILSAKSLANESIALLPSSYTYDGSKKTPAITVQYQDAILRDGVDYEVAYSSNINAGTATVTAKGMGNYTDTLSTTFIINQADISSANVSLSPNSYTYDGKAKTPAVTVKLGNTILQAERDYSVKYENNTNEGEATVTVTGKDNYTGKANKTFMINAASTPTPTPNPVSKDGYIDKNTIDHTGNKVESIINSDQGTVLRAECTGADGKTLWLRTARNSINQEVPITAIGSSKIGFLNSKKGRKITKVILSSDESMVVNKLAFIGSKVKLLAIATNVTINKNAFKCTKQKKITIQFRTKKASSLKLKKGAFNGITKVIIKGLSKKEYKKLLKSAKKVKIKTDIFKRG